MASGWMGRFNPVPSSHVASPAAARRLARAGGGFAGVGVAPGGNKRVPVPLSRRQSRPQGAASVNTNSVAGGGGGTPGGALGGAPVAGAAAVSANAAGNVGTGVAGGQVGAAEEARQRFLRSVGAAQAEGSRQAAEGRQLRGQAFGDLDRLIREPAVSRQALRNIQGQAIRGHRTREDTVNRQTREDLGRAGLLTSGRGVELARRTRAEMGPGLAQAVSQSQTQAELANAQARRSGLSARAGFAGSLPVVGEDMAGITGLLGEQANVLAGREQQEREFNAIQGMLDEIAGGRADTRAARGQMSTRNAGAELIGSLAIDGSISDSDAQRAFGLVQSQGLTPEEALDSAVPRWRGGSQDYAGGFDPEKFNF